MSGLNTGLYSMNFNQKIILDFHVKRGGMMVFIFYIGVTYLSLVNLPPATATVILVTS